MTTLIDNSKRTLIIDRAVQTAPYIKPLPYHLRSCFERENSFRIPYSGVPVGTPQWHTLEYYEPLKPVKSVRTNVHNRALSQLDNNLNVYDNLFEAWYERREAVGMACRAISILTEFATGWRKPSYWKHLAKGVKKPSTLPEAWLAYQFGIKPLVSTVDSVLSIISAPLPMVSVSGRASSNFNGKYPPDNPYIYSKGLYRKKIGCFVKPNPNPLYAMSNIAGLSTPFSTAWSVIPWGWAIDYFVNIGQMLTNVEDKHPGLTTSDWWEAEMFRMQWYGKQSYLTSNYDPETGGYPIVSHDYVFYDGNGVEFTRRLTEKPGYKLEFSVPELGTHQFANLASALALALKGK